MIETPQVPPATAQRWARITEATLGIPFVAGNRVQILKNGVQIFPAMLEAIATAKRSIAFLTFVYWRGDIAERFATALAEAAARGVAVAVILDAFGAARISRRALEILQAADIELRWFRELAPWRPGRGVHRTHRKVLVVDREVGFTGGVGIADEWDGDARDPGEWRETHFRIEGPAVAGLWSAFVGTWFEIDEALPSGWDDAPVHPAGGPTTVQVVRSTACYGPSDVALTLHALVGQAERSIRITTPYFVPDRAFVRLLKERLAAGVEVEILIPGPHIDSELVRLARTELLTEVLEAGAEVWYFQPTMIHAKIVTLDGAVACIGSANLNGRSLRQDDELLLTVLDADIVRRLDEDFTGDVARAQRMSLKRARRRPLWRRSLERVVAPFRRHL
ncbi:MAG: phospholipase D-like domain-containing protein [Nannocystaceae bacterium]